MASLNKVIIIGNLTRDPEVRYAANGNAVCNFTVATNERWKDKSGEQQERTEFHRVVVWGRQAETCGEYLNKGRSVYVEGRLQTREWEDKEGNKRWTTEINADRVLFLGGGGEGSGRGEGGNYKSSTPSSGGGYGGGGRNVSDLDSSDIPF